MNDQVKMFDRESIKNVQDGLVRYARFTVASDEAKTGISDWVLSLALPFNDPKNPVSASKKFEGYMIAEIDTCLKSPQLKAIKGFKEGKMKLTGGNALSSAFRKAFNAMKYGGDLTILTTISQCEKFNKEAKEVEDRKLTAQAIREEITEKLKIEGLTEGTDEFTRRLNDEMSLVLGAVSGSGQGKSKEDDADLDEWDKFGREFADALRMLATDGHNPLTAEQMGEAGIEKVREVYRKAIDNMARTQGLIVDNQAAA